MPHFIRSGEFRSQVGWLVGSECGNNYHLLNVHSNAITTESTLLDSRNGLGTPLIQLGSALPRGGALTVQHSEMKTTCKRKRTRKMKITSNMKGLAL